MKLAIRPFLAVLTVAVLGVGTAVMPVGPGAQEVSALVASDCGTPSFASGTATVTVAGDTCFIDFTIPSTTTGQGTWVVPVGVTSVDYLLVGGGGGGGGGSNRDGDFPYGGGGGGAGGFLEVLDQEVQPGETLTIAVGAGGAGGAAANSVRGDSGIGSAIKRGTTVIHSVNPGGGGGGGRSLQPPFGGSLVASGGGGGGDTQPNGAQPMAGGDAGVLGSEGGSGNGFTRGGGGGGGGFSSSS